MPTDKLKAFRLLSYLILVAGVLLAVHVLSTQADKRQAENTYQGCLRGNAVREFQRETQLATNHNADVLRKVLNRAADATTNPDVARVLRDEAKNVQQAPDPPPDPDCESLR